MVCIKSVVPTWQLAFLMIDRTVGEVSSCSNTVDLHSKELSLTSNVSPQKRSDLIGSKLLQLVFAFRWDLFDLKRIRHFH